MCLLLWGANILNELLGGGDMRELDAVEQASPPLLRDDESAEELVVSDDSQNLAGSVEYFEDKLQLPYRGDRNRNPSGIGFLALLALSPRTEEAIF